MLRPTLRISWKCLLALLNIPLLLILLMQILFISVHLSQGQSKLPRPLQNFIEDQLAAEDLSLQSAGIYYDLEGHLLLKDFSITNPRSNTTIAQGKVAQVRFSRLALLWGKLSLEEMKLMDTSLFTSPMYAKSGQNAPLIENIDLAIHKTPRHWIIKQAQAQIGKIPLSLRGSFKQLKLPRAKEIKPWQVSFFSALADLEESLSQIKDLSQPQINLSLNSGEKETEIKLAAHAQNIDIQGWRAEQAKVKITSALPQDLRKFSITDQLALLTKIELKQWSTPQGVTGDLLLAHAQGKGFHISRSQWQLQGSLQQLYLSQGPVIPYIHLQVDKAKNHWPQLNAFADYRQQPNYLTIACTPQGTWQGQLRSKLNPRLLLDDWPELKLPPSILTHIPQISIGDQLSWQARLNASLFGKIQEVEIQLSAWDCQVNDLALTQAKAQIRWDGQRRILIPEFQLKHQDYQAQGSLDINFANTTLQLYVDGSLHPWDIASWMPSWWPLIWRNFQLNQQTVSGDFYVKVPLVFRRDWLVFGDAHGGGVRFRGLEVNKGHATVLVIPQFVDVYNIHAQRPEGSVQGAVQWVYRRGGQYPEYTAFQVDSGIDAFAFAKCIGPEIESIVQDFTLASPPQLSVSGKIFDIPRTPSTNQKDASWVQIKARHSGASTYHQYPLQDLQFTANYQHKTVALPQIRAQFAQGQLKAQAFYHIAQDLLEVEGALSQASEQDLLSIIESPIKENSNGQVNLNFRGAGIPGNLYGWQGKGNVSISQAQLGKIPLFGFISEFFILGTLSLDRAQSAFVLDRNILRLNDAIIEGPTTRVNASGSHNLKNKSIDFRAKVLPLRQLPLFSPLASVLETHITGTLDKPKWSLSNSPIRIFGKPETDPMIPESLNPSP